jgi:carboxylesterase type B
MMTCAARRAVRKFLDLNRSAYLYLFDHTPAHSVNHPKTSQWGAFHGSEAPFVFNDDFELTGPGENALSWEMSAHRTSFAASGAPKAAWKRGFNYSANFAVPAWPEYRRKGTMVTWRRAARQSKGRGTTYLEQLWTGGRQHKLTNSRVITSLRG